MFLKRHLAARIAVIAAVAVPVASASAATTPVSGSGLGFPRCSDVYLGATNHPAAVCMPWLVINPASAPTTPVGYPITASAPTTPTGYPITSSAPPTPAGYPRCPDNYAGPINPATGCPPWMMIYGPPPGA